MKWLREMFRDRAFFKTVLSFAIPIALQNLLSSSLAIIDNVMIGQLGDIPVGAVGVAAQIAQLVNICIFGVTAGGTVFAAQYWGKKDMAGIRRTYGLVMLNCAVISLAASLFIGLFPEVILRFYTDSEAIIAEGIRYLKIAAFSYIGIAINMGLCTILRSTESVRIPVISNLISVLTNVTLNSILIFGLFGFPRLGVQGAAIGTLVSSFVNPIFILAVSYFKKNVLRSSIKKMFSFPKGFVSKFYRISLPVFFNEAMWALGVAGNNMVFGRMGESNLAALTISRTIENVAFVLIVGVCNACAVMIGKIIGETKFDLARLYAKRFCLLVPLLSFGIGGAILLLRPHILSLFELSSAANTAAMSLILIYCLEMPLRNIPYICIVGIFRPGGDTRTGMLFDLLCLWCFALPITVITGLVLKWEFITVYLLMLLLEDIPKATLCLRHTLSGKWVHSVT